MVERRRRLHHQERIGELAHGVDLGDRRHQRVARLADAAVADALEGRLLAALCRVRAADAALLQQRADAVERLPHAVLAGAEALVEDEVQLLVVRFSLV